jgi:hypothetical protein
VLPLKLPATGLFGFHGMKPTVIANWTHPAFLMGKKQSVTNYQRVTYMVI